MATNQVNLHHQFRANLTLEPINPVYKDRMYVSGFLGFIGTTYKKEMISCDGHREIWTCSYCGQPFESKFHKEKVVSTERFN